MRFALCDAVARCHTRRLRRTFVAAPLPTTAVVVLVALAPVALARVGHALGCELVGVVSDGRIADALVIGPVLAGAVAGAALAVSLPGRSALGPQVAAGPCGDVVGIIAGLLMPLLLCVLAVLPSLVALCGALAGQLPGGRTAGMALAVSVAAAVPAGAVLAECAVAVARGVRWRFLAVLIGALVWAGIGAALGASSSAIVLGPLAPVGAALRGSTSATIALTCTGLALVALSLAWPPLAATRPEKRLRTARSVRRIVRGKRLSVPVAMAVLLSRRDDVRLSVAGALGFGALGIAITTATAAPAPTPFLLATTTALLGSILCSLAVCGVLLSGRWLWLGGPGDRRLIGLAACIIGLTGSALPVAVVGTGATVVSGASGSVVGTVAAIVIVGSATALVAGALAPWSSEGVGDQLTTFAALAALAIAVSVATGLIGPRLASAGLPDATVVILVCGSSLFAALRALDCRLRVAVG